MDRIQATKLLRKTLDENGLPDWKIRLYAETRKMFLGMCSYKDKTIILNTLHVDTHPEVEIKNTIFHEVAHALTPHCGHNNIWEEKARALGCDNTNPCATFGFSAEAIDAVRSGAQLEVEFHEEVVRKMHYKVTRLQDKCEFCGKVAKEKSRVEVNTPFGRKAVITLECLHIIIRNADSQSNFESMTFDGDVNCKHTWNKTICIKCNAKKLYPFQIEGARNLEKYNGRHAIFDEMGLGKTIQVLAYLKFNDDAFPFLWVTKSGIKYQHTKEILRILGMKNFPQVIVNGKTKLIQGMRGYVASYDIFRRLDLEMFKSAGIKTIILDECQAIKNPDSTRTKCIRNIASEISRIIPLSGTPWKNRGSEFFVALNLLNPQKFWSYEDFKRRHVNIYWDGNKTKEGGILHPKQFREDNKDLFTRRERVEVLPELPLISRTRLFVEVPEYARETYKEEEAKIATLYNEAAIGGEEDSFKVKAAIMQSLIVMRQIVGIAKVPSTVEYAQEFLEDTDRKLVIFLHHKKCAELIKAQMTEFCASNGFPQPLTLSADLSPEERMHVQDKFNGNQYRLLIASTLASGEGLNLQTCSDCIMHERQWNPANEEQAEGRFIRIGQQATSVNAIYVLGDDTVDTELDGIVERKRVAFHNSMNEKEVPLWNESDIVMELAQKIAAKRRKK